jgi:hypothetical protein
MCICTKPLKCAAGACDYGGASQVIYFGCSFSAAELMQ